MKTYLEPKEVVLLEKAATNVRDRLLIRLLFRLGCRVSEALAITVNGCIRYSDKLSLEVLKKNVGISVNPQ